MEALKNIIVANNKIVLLSPYRRPVPEGKRYQFVVRVGNYPNIKLYIASDFIYNDAAEAKRFAERAVEQKGFRVNQANIYLQRKNKTL